MALSIDIKAHDEFSVSVNKAADSLDKLAKHEQLVNAQAKAIGASYKVAASYAKDFDVAASKSGAKPNDAAQSKALGLAKKQDTSAKQKAKSESKFVKELKEGAKVIGTAMLAATAAATALGVAAAAAGRATYNAGREAGALLNAWTGQRGPKAMELIDHLAGQIGMKFGEARSKFLEFREAGLDNRLSAKLLKVRADLMALGLSAEAADKEVSRVTSVGHDIYAREAALAELQRSFKGVGTGALAAAAAQQTFAGAEAKISNAFGTELAKAWEEIGPSIGKAAHMVTDFAIEMLRSDEGKAIIHEVVAAFKQVDAVVASGIKWIRENKTEILEYGKAALDVFGWIASAAATIVMAVPKAFMVVGEALGLFASDMYNAGTNAIDGLVNGLTSGWNKLRDTAAGMAKAVYEPFAEALGIKSPSKLFAEYGRNTVEGFERGQEQALPSSMPITQSAAAAPAAQSAGGASISFTIEQIIVQGGGDAQEIGRQIAQQVQLLLQGGDLSRGLI